MRLLTLAIVVGIVIQAQQQPVIRRSVIYVSTDVLVHDDHDRFVADLTRDDFDVAEDGVTQDIVAFTLTHGGQVVSDLGGAAAPKPDGLLLPPRRPRNPESGRILLFFVDDEHISARETPRLREFLTQAGRELIHEGDLFGIVSTGPSSIEVDMTYDRKRLDEAIGKIMGNGLLPSEIIGTPDGSQGPPEVRYRANVAFRTAYEILQRLEQVHNRRKAFVYISEGYDFDPYARSRAKAAADRSSAGGSGGADQVPDTNPFSRSGNEFSAADLTQELAELTREANRANTTIFTIDPRGLTAGPDLDQTTLDSRDWQDHVRETQESLRVIAEQTGGTAFVNTNNLTAALKRIDGETSDYYVLGYYSSNPDPLKTRRTIEIRVKPSAKRSAAKYTLSYRTSYTLKPR